MCLYIWKWIIFFTFALFLQYIFYPDAIYVLFLSILMINNVLIVFLFLIRYVIMFTLLK